MTRSPARSAAARTLSAALCPPAPALDAAGTTYTLLDGPARESVARLLARSLRATQ